MSQQINLYNPLFAKKEQPFSVRTMAQALGLIALGLAALCIYAAVGASSAARLAAQFSGQLSVQREQLSKLAQVSAQPRSKALEADIARLEADLIARQKTLQALSTGELGNTAGFSQFFAAFGRQAVPGVWLTAITIGDSGNELTVQGRALRAELMPVFLRALNNEPIMRGRKVTELKLTAKAEPRPQKGEVEREPRAFIEFSLTAPLQVAEAAPGAPGTP